MPYLLWKAILWKFMILYFRSLVKISAKHTLGHAILHDLEEQEKKMQETLVSLHVGSHA